jgi:hypothetical protein
MIIHFAYHPGDLGANTLPDLRIQNVFDNFVRLVKKYPNTNTVDKPFVTGQLLMIECARVALLEGTIDGLVVEFKGVHYDMDKRATAQEIQAFWNAIDDVHMGFLNRLTSR